MFPCQKFLNQFSTGQGDMTHPSDQRNPSAGEHGDWTRRSAWFGRSHFDPGPIVEGKVSFLEPVIFGRDLDHYLFTPQHHRWL